MGPRRCPSDKFAGRAGAAGPRTTLGVQCTTVLRSRQAEFESHLCHYLCDLGPVNLFEPLFPHL